MSEENANQEITIPRREKRAATRERLIGATINLLREAGVSALNTVNIARAAGIVQSGFYLHFKNLDECKQVAAERVAGEIRDYVARTRREMHITDPDDLDLLGRHCEKMLELFESEHGFAEVFLQYRHDRSPLGAVMRELNERLHADLAEDLQAVIFQTAEVSDDERERIALQARIILAMFLTVGEAVIEKRAGARNNAAALLAVNIMAATDAAFPKDARK